MLPKKNTSDELCNLFLIILWSTQTAPIDPPLQARCSKTPSTRYFGSAKRCTDSTAAIFDERARMLQRKLHIFSDAQSFLLKACQYLGPCLWSLCWLLPDPERFLSRTICSDTVDKSILDCCIITFELNLPAIVNTCSKRDEAADALRPLDLASRAVKVFLASQAKTLECSRRDKEQWK